jgi:hypothetical protein
MKSEGLRLPEIASVLVRLDHLARIIMNAFWANWQP